MKLHSHSGLFWFLCLVLLTCAALAETAEAVSRNVNNRTNTNINHNTNVNRNTNVNVNKNVNVDVDVHGSSCCYHPVATAVAVTAVAATTAAVVGSIVHSVPPSCVTTVVNGVSYSQCGGTWYQPQYVGTTVQYVVVAPPH